MERDALLAHGTSFIVQERLFHCSDEAKALLCAKCGSILSPTSPEPSPGVTTQDRCMVCCRTCDDGNKVDTITLPYVFHFLTNELAAMNIRTSIVTAAERT